MTLMLAAHLSIIGQILGPVHPSWQSWGCSQYKAGWTRLKFSLELLPIEDIVSLKPDDNMSWGLTLPAATGKEILQLLGF